MESIIKLGDCGWSYRTENESAADAIKSVVNGHLEEGFSESDYNELDPEAKEVFDDFACNKVIWVEPNGNLIWEETLEKQVTNAGLEYDEEDLELQGYRKWN